jgi:hypothetical protein
MSKQLVSTIDLYVATTNGQAARMQANVARTLPESLIPTALSLGATFVGETPKPAAEEPGSGILDEVKEAIAQLAEEGNPDNFDSKGKPRLTVLREIVGYPVSADVRDEALKG